jgi:hypothetical protein
MLSPFPKTANPFEKEIFMFNSTTIRRGRFIAAALFTVLTVGALLAQMASARTDNTPPLPASAQQIMPWTAVASTGAVDELNLDDFAFNGARVTYRQGAGVDFNQPIVLRYNVENPNRFENTPGWTTLELTSAAPGGSNVQATLIRVEPCTGQEVPICTAVNPGSEGPVCNLCPQFNPNAIDFQNYLYYVRLTLQAGDQALPVAHALRLLP